MLDHRLLRLVVVNGGDTMSNLSVDDVSRRYRTALASYLADLEAGWRTTVRERGRLAWQLVEWTPAPIPTQGWKIHVSAAATEAVDLCASVLPVLFARRAHFKLPTDVEGIIHINSGEAGPTQLGKVLTVYPRDEGEAASLAAELDLRWPSTRGPAVPSDLALREGGAVFLRYGAFSGPLLVDRLGRHALALIRPDGALVPDQRAMDGAQPEWAPPLPIRCAAQSQPDLCRPVAIEGWDYLFLAPLQHAPRGDVFLAIRLEDAQTVIVKTGRKGVGGMLSGRDAIQRLGSEHRVLTALSRRNVPAPRALGISEDGLLVLEEIDGQGMHELPSDERRAHLPLLAEAIASIHEAGYAHRDVKLSNAIACGGSVRLIDFELAAPIGESDVIPGGTRAYIPPEGSEAPSHPAADAYALGVCIAHAALGCDPATLPGNGRRAIGLMRLVGERGLGQVVESLLRSDPSRRPSAREAAQALRAALSPSTRGAKSKRDTIATPEWCRRAALEAGLATRSFLQRAGKGHFWRNTHLEAGYPCEGVNLGAAGIVLGLASIDHALGRRSFDEDIAGAAEWLAARAPAVEAHGLFTGNAGVALALAVAGRRLNCPSWIERARDRLLAARPPRGDHDLFAGSAGVLWASCLMARILDAEWPLDAAAPMATALMAAAEIRHGVRVWPPYPNEGDALTGAAHGSAGVAMALGVWGRAAGSPHAVDIAIRTFKSVKENATSGAEMFMSASAGDRPPAAVAIWCHGVAGYLWSILHGVGDHPELAAAIDWGVDSLDAARGIGGATYCHGLAGRIELWRMLGRIPRFRARAARRAEEAASTLRLVSHRRDDLCVWSSENPRVVTPDLWVGFLGPASAVALYSSGSDESILSSEWLASCAREAA